MSWPSAYWGLMDRALGEGSFPMRFPSEADKRAFRLDFYKFLQAVRTSSHERAGEAARIEINAREPLVLSFGDKTRGRFARFAEEALGLVAPDTQASAEALLEKLKGLDQ